MAVEQTSGLGTNALRVFEARFGNKDGQHALLDHPPQMRDFFLRLFTKADLPDTSPAGTTWDPFVRGWREDDFYIVALTEADKVAARPGMIATRMVAIPLLQAEKWDDLAAVFTTLREANRAYVPELTIPPRSTMAPQVVHPALLACVAQRLINDEKPVVVVGQDGFEDLVAAIWQKVPPKLRSAFGFGFSFTPTDLAVTRANVVAVPKSCEARWSSYQFKCSAKWSQPMSDLLAAFLNEAQAQKFLEFLRDVGLAFHAFSDYARYARLWDYWQKRGERDHEMAQALLRSLGTLLPAPEHAPTHKEEAMRIAAELLEDASEREILALRSVKATAFPSSGVPLELAICRWLKLRIQSPQADNNVGLAKVIAALPSSQSVEWQQWVRKGLKQAFAVLNETATQTVWSVLGEEGTFDEVGAQLPSDARTEAALIRSCPANLSAKLVETLETWCVDRGWICLMAKAAFIHSGFAQAMALVVAQSQGKPRTAAIELLCERAKPLEIWTTAFTFDDAALVNCAVAAAKLEPALWNRTDNEIIRWIVLFEAAAKTDPGFLRAFDASPARARLFDAWDKDLPVSEATCLALEEAGLLEFTSYPNRSCLWQKLPRRYLTTSLANTLRAWLKDYYSRPPIKPSLEKELIAILFSPQHTEFTFPRNSPFLGVGGLILVERWGHERDSQSWIHALITGSVKLKSDVAKRAGNVATQRRWMSLAKTAKDYDERRSRDDLRPIWETYYNSLGHLDKFAFNYLSGLSFKPSNRHTQDDPMTHAVFVTALPEEFSAVAAHLADRKEHTEKGTIYEIGRFGDGNAQCTVAVVQTGMGNALSAAATERALSLFKPDFAFFVGIAGGLRDDLKIGDVVAASKVYGYEGGKSGANFQPRPDAPHVSHEAEQRANAVVRAKAWQKRIKASPRSSPDAIVRPIAAGEKVLVSELSEDLKRVRSTYTDAYAVAMEDHGFATAIRAHPSVCFAVVRGISDLIENKSEADKSGSHEIAASSAAAFAFEMLAGMLRGRTT